MLIRSLIVLSAYGLFSGAMLSPASAQTKQEGETACRNDAFRYCEAEIPDSDRVEQCLRRNRDRISQACRALLK